MGCDMSTNIVHLRPRRGIEFRNFVPDRELCNAFGACQWWLSKSWLNESFGTHPMQLLWRETGWATDVECYLIGQAIYHLHKNGTKRNALEAKKVEFLGKQTGNQRGYLFELLTALLLLAGGNDVELLEASAKGYDLDVRTPNGHDIQVSCKVVQHSELHKKFTGDARIFTCILSCR